MICTACGKSNLPGGVRCLYCGGRFPATPDFDLDAGSPGASHSTTGAAPSPTSPRRALPSGVVGLIVLVLLKGKSLLTLLKIGPLLTTFGTMFLWIQVESQLYGWRVAVGLALCIFVHELGHVWMNRRHGIPSSAPMFIPFLGALITVRHFPANPTVESESAAGGPGAGLLASVACLVLAAWTGDSFFTGLAALSFGINLFNLLPFWTLDGARIGTALGPRNWDVLLGALLLILLKAPLTALWPIFIVMVIVRLGRPAIGRHNLAAPVDRWRMTAVYLFLCLSLAGGLEASRGGLEVIVAERVAARRQQTSAATPGRRPDKDTSEDPAERDPAADASRRSATDRSKGQSPAWAAAAPLLRYAVLAVGSLFLCLAWLGVGALLARAAGEPFGTRGWLFAGGMSSATLAAASAGVWIARAVPGLPANPFPLLGGLAAALGAGLLYAAIQADRPRNQEAPSPRARYTWRCLAWAAAGALAGAYAWDEPSLVATVACVTIVFYSRRPWLAPAVLGSLWNKLGNADRTIRLRRRAIAMRPDPDTAAVLWQEIARNELELGHGGAALTAIEASDAISPRAASGSAAVLAAQALRVEALLLTDRPDDALAQCELLLRGPEPDRNREARVLLAHLLLASLASVRGWPDEMRAQAEVVLNALHGHADGGLRVMTATARRLRGEALLESGQADAAAVEVERARAYGLSPADERGHAILAARIRLIRGEPAEAARELRAVVDRTPGHCAARFWLAAALHAAGRRDEALQLWGLLAREAPGDHWARRARQASTGVPPA